MQNLGDLKHYMRNIQTTQYMAIIVKVAKISSIFKSFAREPIGKLSTATKT